MYHDFERRDASTFPDWTYDVLGMSFDAASGTVNIRLASDGIPSFTPKLSRDLLSFTTSMRSLTAHDPENACGVRYVVMTSDMPGMFSMGGDLGHFAERAEAGDHAAVKAYAHAVLEVMYGLWSGFGGRIVTVALVEGDALGGGYEAALVHNVLVAERGVRIGLPEVNYNFFPGMGAVSFLSRRMGEARTKDFILGGKVHLAEEVHDMGGVDVLVGRGEARAWLEAEVTGSGDAGYARLLAARDERMARFGVTHGELLAIIDAWADNVMALDPQGLAHMRRIASVQRRKMARIYGESAA